MKKEIPELGSPNRVFPDWIETFQAYAHNDATPPIFTEWAAISAIAATLERRVCVYLQPGRPVYPNLYIMLVSHPGAGKSSAIGQATNLIRGVRDGTRRVYFTPDDATKASIIDAMKSQDKFQVLNSDNAFEQTPIYMAMDEIGTSMDFKHPELLAFLSKMFDPIPHYTEQKRGRGDKAIILPNPTMNIIAGAQPKFLAEQVSEAAWGQGFMARFIMPYADPIEGLSIYSDSIQSSQDYNGLVNDLTEIFKLIGTLSISDGAVAVLRKTDRNHFGSAPSHPRLTYYTSRRGLFLGKLMIISACSRSNSMIITKEDVLRAMRWLSEAEQTMIRVFDEMSGQSDDIILKETHYAVLNEYRRTGDAVPISFLYNLLSRRVKSTYIKSVIEIACNRGDYMKGLDGTWATIIPKGGDR